jgi:hypothetical protein
MLDAIKQYIQALVDFESKGCDTKNPELFLSMLHPDMVWPWPPRLSQTISPHLSQKQEKERDF